MEPVEKLPQQRTADQSHDRVVPPEAAAPTLRAAARDAVARGVDLETFLDDLGIALEVLGLPAVDGDLLNRAGLAWAEATTEHHRTTGRDVITGLTDADQARLRLGALYRVRLAGRMPFESRALVVVELLESERTGPGSGSDGLAELRSNVDHTLRMATVAETLYAVFDDCDVAATVARGTVVAVVRKDRFLANRVDELGWLLRRRLPVRSAPRAQCHLLPGTEAEALALFDDLAR